MQKQTTTTGLNLKRYSRPLEIVTKPKNRAYTTVVFSFLVTSLFSWYAIRPTFQTILFLKREIRDKVIVNQEMEEKISNLIQAQSVYQTLESDLFVVTEALPERPDIVTLASQIQKAAAKSGVSIILLHAPSLPLFDEKDAPVPPSPESPEEPQVENDTKPLPLKTARIDTVISGPYNNVAAFLKELLTLRRIVAIKSITLTPTVTLDSPSSTEGTPVQATMTLETYYHPKNP
ncbi:MAG: type 4a pilus biogenesis protein PilO [bacterium]|nr:type 4a pilus biogenesis protein PilO [bacterium]